MERDAPLTHISPAVPKKEPSDPGFPKRHSVEFWFGVVEKLTEAAGSGHLALSIPGGRRLILHTTRGPSDDRTDGTTRPLREHAAGNARRLTNNFSGRLPATEGSGAASLFHIPMRIRVEPSGETA